MLNGEWVYQKSKSEQEDVIARVCEEFIEILNNFYIITSTFPDSMLEAIRNTNAMLFLANTYCLVIFS